MKEQEAEALRLFRQLKPRDANFVVKQMREWIALYKPPKKKATAKA